MLILERYKIEPTSDSIHIEVDQKKNALVNIVIGLVVIGFASYIITAAKEVSSFYYFLQGIGVLWLLAAVYGYRSRRSYYLANNRIEYRSSGRSGPKSLRPEDLSHVFIHKNIRPTGRTKKKVPLPWRVKLLDKEGNEFKRDFRFQDENNARELAGLIAEFYGVEVKRSEG